MKPFGPHLLSTIVGLFVLGLASCSETSKGTRDSPVDLPSKEQEKITGKAYLVNKVFDTKHRLRAEIYNGTDWTLTDVDVVATKAKTQDKRRFRLEIWDWEKNTKITLQPYSTGEFAGKTGDFLDAPKAALLDGPETKGDDWSWGIVSARGFKP